jgi:hypothetical protein
MTDVVFRHRGTVDKYIGDAIIALYNVPFEAPDHAAQAVRTAVEFQERLEPLAERFAANHGGALAAHPPHLAAHVGGLPGQRDPPCGGRAGRLSAGGVCATSCGESGKGQYRFARMPSFPGSSSGCRPRATVAPRMNASVMTLKSA